MQDGASVGQSPRREVRRRKRDDALRQIDSDRGQLRARLHRVPNVYTCATTDFQHCASGSVLDESTDEARDEWFDQPRTLCDHLVVLLEVRAAFAALQPRRQVAVDVAAVVRQLRSEPANTLAAWRGKARTRLPLRRYRPLRQRNPRSRHRRRAIL
ncbi:hypothetical protein AWB95_11855 [Mycobacterium celatum]|uniref:Uncharacterized protein n=1 Tax=Mycobacterium celatum TaxID=28045 RepID=A0A1X1RQI3_MYCCE|nr:hypothetical protein AWB95_11855 [Mycobacterium celatum]